MNLETLYTQVKDAIASLDFNRIWPGFKPLKFALYDNEKCFFDGQYIEKTNAFCANTSIVFEGEQIAIWMVQQELKISTLASKLVHEMFHGYQSIIGIMEDGPNELEALYHYEYNAENLSLKLRENELLLDLLDGFDDAKLNELFSHRKRRSVRFPYEFTYESKTEQIEGTANYVEWQVLKQLEREEADALTARMREMMTRPEYLFPIRISCYYTGALMTNALLAAGSYNYEASIRSVVLSELENISTACGDYPNQAELANMAENAVKTFYAETDRIIRLALENNKVVLKGPVELKGVNVYNARCKNGFITSTYFLMYNDGTEDKLLPGNFVIKMQDEKTISCVYLWE